MKLSPGNKYKLKERGTEDRTGTVVDQHVYESGDEDGANVGVCACGRVGGWIDKNCPCVNAGLVFLVSNLKQNPGRARLRPRQPQVQGPQRPVALRHGEGHHRVGLARLVRGEKRPVHVSALL